MAKALWVAFLIAVATLCPSAESFSRKGAKAQRIPLRDAAALCAFAPLRERSSISQQSSHFRVIHPQTVDHRHAEHVLNLLEANRIELLHRVASAGLEVNLPNLQVVFNETTGDFVGRTGMPPWAAAATKRNSIELQPLKLLKQRRILETTLRHELVHALIDALGDGQTPRWLTEGMALFIAGEGKFIEQTSSMSVAMVEQALAAPKSADEMKSAYAAAYNLVKELIRSEGEKKVWKRVADRSYSL